MATDSRGHTVPASTGHPARSDLLALSKSLRDIAVVANTTARAALVTALTADSLTPSTSNPLYVWRTDAGLGRELEVTSDGSTWRTIRSGTARASFTFSITPASGTFNLGTTGTTWGNWNQDGEYAEGEAGALFGGTGISVGAGLYALAIPTAPLAAMLTQGDEIGRGSFLDSSTGIFYEGHLIANATTTARLLLHGAGAWSASAPVVPAAGDRVNLRFRYPMA